MTVYQSPGIYGRRFFDILSQYQWQDSAEGKKTIIKQEDIQPLEELFALDRAVKNMVVSFDKFSDHGPVLTVTPYLLEHLGLNTDSFTARLNRTRAEHGLKPVEGYNMIG
jgi:hypothetical protein